MHRTVHPSQPRLYGRDGGFGRSKSEPVEECKPAARQTGRVSYSVPLSWSPARMSLIRLSDKTIDYLSNGLIIRIGFLLALYGFLPTDDCNRRPAGHSGASLLVKLGGVAYLSIR